MRLKVRNTIINLIPTIEEGIKYSQNADSKTAFDVLNDCYDAVISIFNTLDESLSEEKIIAYANLISPIVELINEVKNDIDNKQNNVERTYEIGDLLNEIKYNLLNDSEVKLEIAFLPYKASMWDSLESIWRAAKDDPRCNCHVVPIPYYVNTEKNDFSIMEYEGDKFDNEIPIVHYNDYDIALEKPDIIYIHNPYDEYNQVTSVDSRFYSSNLKNHTEMLVYVPYYISEATYNKPKEVAPFHMMPSVFNVNKIIVQSKIVADAYLASGCPASKLCILGSPKFDAIINFKKDNSNVPTNWKNKIQNKKVILLNTSITGMLRMNKQNEWINYLRHTIDLIMDKTKDSILIWRPHPLLESTILSMRKHYYEEYIEIKKKVINSEFAIYDDTTDYRLSISLSDALISDISSIARIYLATGKPMYIFGRLRSQMRKFRAIDFSACTLNDDSKVDEFIDNIIAGLDNGTNERIMCFNNSVVNSDGTCGSKINNYIIEEVFKKAKERLE